MKFFKEKKIEGEKLVDVDIGYMSECLELVKQLTSIESHSIQSYIGTKDDSWLERAKKARKLRTRYLSKITLEIPKSQSWCISKHLAESLMRLQELNTRHLSMDDVEGAKECLKDLEELTYMFFEINKCNGKNESSA